MNKKFKLVTLLGIRPDYIRMSKLIKLIDEQAKDKIEHILVHSGQHYDEELFGVFLKELGVRNPDVDLGIGLTLKERGESNFALQTGLLDERLHDYLVKEKPDAVMYLGDTNTVLSSVVVARLGIPVIHLEAGGRSFDWRMPEEKCRLTIDHLSDALYCYLPRYKELLLAEGVADFRATSIGNIIVDAVDSFMDKVEASNVLSELNLESKKFILITLHREENTTNEKILERKLTEIGAFAKEKGMPVVFPLMPRVRAILEKANLMHLVENDQFIVTKPLGFFDFMRLEKEARLIISDSGTVQEEGLILGTPTVIARQSTERPETMWAGATILQQEERDGRLTECMNEAWDMPTDWDKNVLNPDGGSPSERVLEDLIKKIDDGYFKKSRSYEMLKDSKFVRRAYGKEGEND